ncbi:TetR/AcrR family transcriptional regulator [Streptomyces spectabilis]|uniref:AcrR family transcriptional regulator n=1 Tax=Streptomyces spectabilis TaxID=68270 RepID=A0A5P2X3N3_STRST|nr:TetR/AcrR family transcriptional regulator [Streptomyces spectabilis]MBB5101101.1 AcrR family transcriptional regulator [Streptomyces spectabilis]MCI3900310.1 TetR/AcrR family transcriptional regulator [Streptomyces spectabilis]QEV57899.1 TetR/AcrR family transcriptional regulator [Streptomyces spectabilis]GGV09373.1 TetR family transcriptional regulator [Streptomyces spectabilis]
MTQQKKADGRRSQADRRAQTRGALLEAAARGLSTYGYANLSLARVADEAGYTRGALYHLFANKEALALAVVEWVGQTWNDEVGRPAMEEPDPVDALIALARGHAVYCRRDVAQVMMTLRVEFTGQDHPVGRAVAEAVERLGADCAGLVAAGRASGAIPPGPPPEMTASVFLGVVEAVGIELAGQAPYDTQLAERAVRGVLGLSPRAEPTTR